MERLTSDNYLVKHVGHKDEVRTILFIDSLQMIFSAGWDCVIYGWAMPSFRDLHQIDLTPKIALFGHSAGIVGLAHDTIKNRLFSVSKDGFIRIYGLNNYICTSITKVSKLPLFSLAFDSTMQFLITGGADKTLRIWDVGSNSKPKCISNLSPLLVPIHVVKDFPNCHAVIGSGDDNSLKVWIYSQAYSNFDISYSHELVGHRKVIFSFDNHPLKPIIASGGQEKAIFLWDFQTGEPIRKILTQSPISYLKFSPCGDYLLCVCFDNSVRIYNTETGASCRQFPMHEGHQSTIGLSSDWSLLAVAPFRGNIFAIRLWALKMPKDN